MQVKEKLISTGKSLLDAACILFVYRSPYYHPMETKHFAGKEQLCHISGSEAVRRAIDEGTELSNNIRDLFKRGE